MDQERKSKKRSTKPRVSDGYPRWMARAMLKAGISKDSRDKTVLLQKTGLLLSESNLDIARANIKRAVTRAEAAGARVRLRVQHPELAKILNQPV